MSDGGPDIPEHRLDPEAAARGGERPPSPPPPVIDTRPYRRAIGFFGLLLVVLVSGYLFATRGIQTAGVAAGKQLHIFAAPLADSTLNGDANLNPPCTIARHDPRALNICLLVRRAPLVLGFFVTSSQDCKRQVDTLQAVSREFRASQVQFAAVAVRAGHGVTAKLVQAHRWTIPVAYDADGAVGALYGVAACPLLELAHRGGLVAQRLIGTHWLSTAALSAHVRELLG